MIMRSALYILSPLMGNSTRVELNQLVAEGLPLTSALLVVTGALLLVTKSYSN